MSDRKKAKPGRVFSTFLCCCLGVPACTQLVPGLVCASMEIALTAGVLLGVAYLIVRPILRLITLPLGCLTFGLFKCVIDVALLYVCAQLIDGFEIEHILSAIGTALVINTISGIVGGFR